MGYTSHSPRERVKRHYQTDEKTLKVWDETLRQLRLQMTRASFDTWLRQSFLISLKDDVATIGAHNVNTRDWLQHRLYKVIQRTLAQVLGDDEVELEFTVLEGVYGPVGGK